MLTAVDHASLFVAPAGITLGSSIAISRAAIDQLGIEVYKMRILDDSSLEVALRLEVEDLSEETWNYAELVNPDRSLDDVSVEEWGEYERATEDILVQQAIGRLEIAGIPRSGCRNVKLIKHDHHGARVECLTRFFVEPNDANPLDQAFQRYATVNVNELSVSIASKKWTEMKVYHELSDPSLRRDCQLTDRLAYLLPWHHWWRCGAVSADVSERGSGSGTTVIIYEFISPDIFDDAEIRWQGDEFPLFRFRLRPVLNAVQQAPAQSL